MQIRGRCVVLGASLGGLFAARALSDSFERVTLVERDRLPVGFEHRKGVPQSRHTHGLLSAGYRVIEDYFPGITEQLGASGALTGDAMDDSRYCIGGQLLKKTSSDLRSITVSRPVLEGHIRRRVLGLPNVDVIDNCDVLGLEGDANEVRGVRILRRTDGSAEERLSADLVVDATGRGSRMPAWLEALGVAPPEEERVRVDISYTTGIYPRRPDHAGGDRVLIVGATPPNRRCGVAVAFEKEHFIVTLVGYLGERAPTDPAAFAAFALTLPSPMLHEIVRDDNPTGELVTAKFPHSQRRRYEKLRHFPKGLLVFGDALCSFNPIHGQGISVAALEANLLGECVRNGGSSWRKFFAGAARIIDMPWAIAVGNDLRFDEVEGKRSRTARLQNAYIARLLAAATVDPVVALAFIRVVHLIEPLPSLFAPAVLLRVLRHVGASSEAELDVERLSQSAVADLVRGSSEGYSRELDAE